MASWIAERACNEGCDGSRVPEGTSCFSDPGREDTKVLRQNLQGTVLIRDEAGQLVQPIVPLGAVIEDLGCTLKWKKGLASALSPETGMMKVKLVNNCPESRPRTRMS